MTRIAINLLSIYGFTSGLSVFVNEILQGMQAYNDAERRIVLFVRNREKEQYLTLYPSLEIHGLPRALVLAIRHMPMFMRGEILTRLFKHYDINVVWEPAMFKGSYYKSIIPTVFTVHDIIPVHENANLVPIYEKLFKTPQKYVCGSNYVKQDIISTIRNVNENMFDVIPNAILVDKQYAVHGLSLSCERFILDINAYSPRKNPITLLKAFKLIEDLYDGDLVFCGGYIVGDTLANLEALAKKLCIENRVHFLYQVSQNEKLWLLRHADLFVSPTLSEGFGRTPIEAAMNCVPVLTTKVDSIPEVTMGLVHYVDNPTDEEEYSRRILALLSNAKNQEILQEIATRLQAEYAPQVVASKYINILNSVI